MQFAEDVGKEKLTFSGCLVYLTTLSQLYTLCNNLWVVWLSMMSWKECEIGCGSFYNIITLALLTKITKVPQGSRRTGR
jgi:hypothetical protein